MSTLYSVANILPIGCKSFAENSLIDCNTVFYDCSGTVRSLRNSLLIELELGLQVHNV